MTNEEFIESVTLDGEEWRDVIGFEGLYMVSSFGRVVSLGRFILPGKGGKKRFKKPKLIHPSLNHNGYYKVTLSKDGTPSYVRIHRLVGESFIPNPNNYQCLDHIDTNTKNNHINNLRWCTLKENQNNTISLIKMSKAHKARCANGRMYVRPIVRISLLKNDIKKYNSIKEAEMDGFSHQSISKCCLHQMNKHKGYKWMYLSDYETLINKSKNDLLSQ